MTSQPGVVITLTHGTRLKLRKLAESVEAMGGNGNVTNAIIKDMTSLTGYFDGEEFEEPQGFASSAKASAFVGRLLQALGKHTGRESMLLSRAAFELDESEQASTVRELIEACKECGLEVGRTTRYRDR